MQNYFDFFGLPVSFYPDLEKLKSQFKANILQNHPDLNAGDLKSEQFTALNNNAFSVLRDEKKRIAYILKLNGLLDEENKATLPPDFLMEMMELNEALFELEAEEKPTFLKEIEDRNQQLWLEIRKLGQEYDSDNLEKETTLKSIEILFLQSKYLDRMLNT